MRRLLHSVILSSDEVIPFSFCLSLLSVSLSVTVLVAPSPIKPSTKLAARSSGNAGDALFLVRANEFSPDRCSLSLPLSLACSSLSLSLSFYFILFYFIFHGGKRLCCMSAGFCRTRARARARDCSRLNKDRSKKTIRVCTSFPPVVANFSH